MSGLSGTTILLKDGSNVIAGSRSKSLSINNVLVDVSSKDDAWVKRVVGKKDWTVSLSGVIGYGANNGEALAAKLISGTKVTLAWGPSSPSAGQVVYSGEAFIESVELEAGDDEAATYAVSLSGDGALTRTVTPGGG